MKRRDFLKILAQSAAGLSVPGAAYALCPPKKLLVDGVGSLQSDVNCLPGIKSDVPDYPDPLAGVTMLNARTTVNVSTSSQLNAALANAVAGQTIQLSAGTYSGNFTVSKSAPKNNPIVIKGAANFASVLTGAWSLGGSNCTILQCQFSGADARVIGSGIENRIIACRLTGWKAGQAITAAKFPAARLEVAYCEFYSPGAWNNLYASSGGTQTEGRYGLRTDDDGVEDFHVGGWIHHCWFHDFPTKPIVGTYHSGQSDAIEIGQSQIGTYPKVNAGWYVEHNLIERHLGRDANIDLKVGGVVCRFNTLDTTNGENGRIDLRGGTEHPSVMESNWVGPGGGISIHGGYHRIAGNYVRGGEGIKLNTGSVEFNQPVPGHACAAFCTLAGNDSSSTLIGSYDFGDFYAHDNRIEAHVGTWTGSGYSNVTLRKHLRTTQVNTTSLKFAKAVRLTSAQVGPNALHLASPAWLAKRILS